MIQAAHVGVGISGVEVRLWDFCCSVGVLRVFGVQGTPSGSVSGCGDFAVSVSEEITFGSWSVELSTLVEAYTLFVVLLRCAFLLVAEGFFS
jgi:hypothetical protein